MFGLFLGPLYSRWLFVNSRIYGDPTKVSRAALQVFGAQQFLATPLVLFLYFTTMTGVRGGFTDSHGLMSAHLSSESIGQTTFGISDVLSYIALAVLPTPLMWSWLAFGPAAAFSFFGLAKATRGLSNGIVLLPWVTYVAIRQKDMLM